MIFICEICRNYRCPPSCPGYTGHLPGLGRPIGICAVCGETLREDDGAYNYKSRLICESCAECAVTDELLILTNCNNFRDFFDLLRSAEL